MPPLNPNGLPVAVGRVTLRTPGLEGSASELPTAAEAVRARTLSSEAFETALTTHGFERQEVVEITGAREIPGAVETRGTRFDGPAIEVEVPSPGATFGQLLLYTDEAGVCTWHLARDAEGRVADTRGNGTTRTYLIRRAVAATDASGATRGVLGLVGSKLLQVLVFPLIDKFVGKIAQNYAEKWEEHNRPYQVRTFTPANYTQPADSLSAADWARLQGGVALLFVHGTFGRAAGAFPTLPVARMQEFDQLYQGRLLAFDHFTISHDPLINAQHFVRAMPAGAKLELDIFCHSRGGLVSRALSERADELGLGDRQLTVRRLVFVASPNAGCVLADPDYMTHFVDRYTNWVNFLPSSGVTDVLSGVLTVLKQLAAGVLGGMSGLESMVPQGPFLKKLNSGNSGSGRYYALSSNYEPKNPDLKAFARNALMDQIFAAENDLVVPTAGVWDKNGSGHFPLVAPDLLLFGPQDAIDHGGFFADEASMTQVMTWLSVP